MDEEVTDGNGGVDILGYSLTSVLLEHTIKTL